MSVRTRFAPSPTGSLHIGGVRTALFSWLYARRHGGTYILRIEDTDRERSTDAAVEVILEAFAWLDLKPDEGPFFQSRRFDRYRDVADGMIRAGTAYRCYCTPEELAEMRAQQTARGEKPRYDGRCRGRAEPRPGVTPVVRFRNPDAGQVVVDDLVHGRVVFENAELDDLVIVRSDGTPTYNFGVVVDDADMRITHVIRGDDHLNNTPKQINLFAALGHEPPRFAHIPMIAGPDGAKLSKRHGAVSVLEYRELGYLPDAILNYLARLGWSHGDQEIFSRDELTRLFDLAQCPAFCRALRSREAELAQPALHQGDAGSEARRAARAALESRRRRRGAGRARRSRRERVSRPLEDAARDGGKGARVSDGRCHIRAEGRAEASPAVRGAAVARGA